jgi:hypothetical protein
MGKQIASQNNFSMLALTNKTMSKNTYFYTLPSIPSHQGRGNLLPLPWWERARVRGCGFTYELLSIFEPEPSRIPIYILPENAILL